MIAQWMLAALILGSLLTIAGHCIAGLQTRLGFARRWLWLMVMVISIAAPIGLSLRGSRPTSSEQLLSGQSFQSLSGQSLPGLSLVNQSLSSLSANQSLRSGAAPCCALIDSEVNAHAQRDANSFDTPLLVLWALLSLSFATVLGVAHLRAVRRLRSWRRDKVHGESVVISPDFGPAVVGVIRTTVVLPEWVLGLSPHEQELVLRHELEHIRAGDQFVLLAGVLLSVLMPWNVALWWQLRRLRIGMELDCDARVAPTPRERPRYADLLLQARRLRPAQQTALGFISMRSALAERLFALLDRREPTAKQTTAWSVSVVACAAMLLRVPVPDVRPAFESPAQLANVATRAPITRQDQPNSAVTRSISPAMGTANDRVSASGRNGRSKSDQPKNAAPVTAVVTNHTANLQVRYDILQPFDIDKLMAAKKQQCGTCGKARGARASRVVDRDTSISTAANANSDSLGFGAGSASAAAGRRIGPDSLPGRN